MESAKVIAGLTRMVRDVGMAEDLAQDALVVALEQWPAVGHSATTLAPGSWPRRSTAPSITSAGTRCSSASTRSWVTSSRRAGRESAPTDLDAAIDDDVGDDLLRLIFTACHPVLSTEARVALTLRLLGGLTTEEIARAFLVPEPTIAQRIVRAKRTLAEAQVPFEVPRGAERAARLRPCSRWSICLQRGIFGDAGDDWMRPGLCDEALRLGRMLAELAPVEPEVHGLVALMEIQASRARARVGAVRRAHSAARSGSRAMGQPADRPRTRGARAGRAALGGTRGPYAMQAAIAACHARARTAAETDWERSLSLYEDLSTVSRRRSWT